MLVRINGKFDIDFEVSGAAGREPYTWVMIRENGELKVEKVAGGTLNIWRWRILPSAIQDFLALPEDTEICHLSDQDGNERIYHKYDIFKVIVVSEFAEIPSPSAKVFLSAAELMSEETEDKVSLLDALLSRCHPRWGLQRKEMSLHSAYLTRPRTNGEPSKFTLSFGLVTACDKKCQLMVEAVYPDAFQRALFKIGGLLEPDNSGFVPKYFVGCQSGRLYNVSVRGVGLAATVLEDELDIRKTGRIDGLKIIDGIGSRGSLPLGVLEGTDYLMDAVDDVDGLVRLAFVNKNCDLMRNMGVLLTDEEQAAVAEIYG